MLIDITLQPNSGIIKTIYSSNITSCVLLQIYMIYEKVKEDRDFYRKHDLKSVLLKLVMDDTY